jgi:8-oxo-dGTP pyrophosphatase MutT (NUDIX family)
MEPLDPAWIARLEARASQPPLRAREPLTLAAGDIRIGSVEPHLGARIAAAGLALERPGGGWQIYGPVDAALASIAAWLDANRLCSRWRGELLTVTAQDGTPVGSVERAASRALGLTTRAVHLVGRSADGAFWVQQRAFDKATDPGLWDTLMGGLITAGESVADTLARETLEEAGLGLDALRDLAHRGRISIRRPVVDGYMVEHIEIFEALVPDGVEPVNRDGEVERFERLVAAPLLERLHADAFTLEAALVLVGTLQRR